MPLFTYISIFLCLHIICNLMYILKLSQTGVNTFPSACGRLSFLMKHGGSYVSLCVHVCVRVCVCVYHSLAVSLVLSSVCDKGQGRRVAGSVKFSQLSRIQTYACLRLRPSYFC